MGRLARSPLTGVVAGIVVGGVIVGALAVRDFSPTRTPGGHPAPSPDAFLAAWERKLTGTWVVVSAFSRTTEDGRTLNGEIVEVQRPPDRLRRGLGSVEGRIAGRRIGCAATVAGSSECREGGIAPPYDEEVAAELALLRGYVLGPTRLYTVIADRSGCFHLRLVQRMLAPPYGEAARFCFDAATGALRSSEVSRGGALDVTRAVEVRADVTDADLTP